MNRRSFLLGASAGSIVLLSDDEVVEYYAPKKTYVDMGRSFPFPEPCEFSVLSEPMMLSDHMYFVVTSREPVHLIYGVVYSLEPGMYVAQVNHALFSNGQRVEHSRRIQKIGNGDV